MRKFNARLEGTALTFDHQIATRLSCLPQDFPSPGQAVLAHKNGDLQPLRKLLFPIQAYHNGFIVDSPPEPSWRIGDTLNLWGPFGNGFIPPQEADQWLLASFENPPRRLYALLQMGLERGVAISLCTDKVPDHLPPQVEWIPEISDALAWANYLALDIPAESMKSLRTRLGISSDENLPFPAQVLVTQPIPCGLGVCYACAIKGHQNQLLSCKDGPVFELNQLEF
jgi:hypothetical protein